MTRRICDIAEEIERTWGNWARGGASKVSPHARPYLDAMHELNDLTENFYYDSAKSVVLYFLANAAGWRGEDARRIKAELNEMLKGN